MIFRVALTTRAEQDRDRAFAWYAENYSYEFAVRWYDGLMTAIESLQHNPLRCGEAHERHKFTFDVRELLFGRRRNKHRILFEVRDDLVVVIHIRHSARRDLQADDL